MEFLSAEHCVLVLLEPTMKDDRSITKDLISKNIKRISILEFQNGK